MEFITPFPVPLFCSLINIYDTTTTVVPVIVLATVGYKHPIPNLKLFYN